MKPPRKITVYVDDREKDPVLFPVNITWYPSRNGKDVCQVQVVTERKRLRTGDYFLKHFRSTCIVEKKGSLDEVKDNVLGAGTKRFHAQLDRLRTATRYPYLLLTESFSKMTSPTRWCKDPMRAIGHLLTECTRRNIHLLWIGGAHAPRARVRLGEALIRIMLTHALVEPWAIAPSDFPTESPTVSIPMTPKQRRRARAKR